MKKVLVVEDDPNINELIQIHLKDLNYDIHVCNHGKRGFEEAKNNTYDLIILDIMLPEMDGIAICQRLRALDNYTPILMITAKSEEIDKVIGLESELMITSPSHSKSENLSPESKQSCEDKTNSIFWQKRN